MRSPSRLELDRLARKDIESLAALKLWEEVGVPVAACARVLRETEVGWLVGFLSRDGARIASWRVDRSTLARARFHYEVVPRGLAMHAGVA